MRPEVADDIAELLASEIVEVSLHTDDPGDDGSNEVSDLNYSRQAVTWTSGEDGERISDTLTFDLDPGTIWGLGFWDGSNNFVDSEPFEIEIVSSGSYSFAVTILIPSFAS